ncbi:hypothetical protein FA15DRAFT_691766, partial [Coprinopsis marcescibilis]
MQLTSVFVTLATLVALPSFSMFIPLNIPEHPNQSVRMAQDLNKQYMSIYFNDPCD